MNLLLNIVCIFIEGKSLYEELTTIEEQRISIESDIASEETIITTLSKSNIKRFLNQLKDGNENDLKHRKSLIATFLNCVYIYKDKAIIYFNNQKDPVEISLEKLKMAEKFFSGKVRPAIYDLKIFVFQRFF